MTDSGTKIAKNTQKMPNKLILRFFKNLKHMPHVVFDEESKTDLGFEIGQ